MQNFDQDNAFNQLRLQISTLTLPQYYYWSVSSHMVNCHWFVRSTANPVQFENYSIFLNLNFLYLENYLFLWLFYDKIVLQGWWKKDIDSSSVHYYAYRLCRVTTTPGPKIKWFILYLRFLRVVGIDITD